MMKRWPAAMICAALASALCLAGTGVAAADSPTPSPSLCAPVFSTPAPTSSPSAAPTPTPAPTACPTPAAPPASADDSVSITGVPAVVDFGAAVPGSVAHSQTINLVVYSTNPSGASLAVTLSDLVGPNNVHVPASAVHWTVGSSDYEVAGAGSPLSIWTTDASTGTGGAAVEMSAYLTVPWLASGDYTGTAVFVVGLR